jgi:glycine/serine hydroxymethyltransferase
MREPEMDVIAAAIDLVLQAPEDESVRERARTMVLGLCSRFPLPYAPVA